MDASAFIEASVLLMNVISSVLLLLLLDLEDDVDVVVVDDFGSTRVGSCRLTRLRARI